MNSFGFLGLGVCLRALTVHHFNFDESNWSELIGGSGDINRTVDETPRRQEFDTLMHYIYSFTLCRYLSVLSLSIHIHLYLDTHISISVSIYTSIYGHFYIFNNQHPFLTIPMSNCLSIYLFV